MVLRGVMWFGWSVLRAAGVLVTASCMTTLTRPGRADLPRWRSRGACRCGSMRALTRNRRRCQAGGAAGPMLAAVSTN